jgi:hypothetical protein
MKLVIRSVWVWGHPNIRTWQPDDPETIAELVFLEIGDKAKSSSDTFTLRVATPAGLATLESQEGIIATRPLLVMKRYDFDDLWRWLERTVAKCEKNTWSECVENLRLYFGWEYENYKER